MLASVERRAVSLESEGAWLLLAELNHRVGNELQVALSALHLAKRGLPSADSASFIEQAALRLEALGSIQQLLDREHGEGPLADRLEALCRAMSLAKAAPRGIHLTLNLDDVTVDEETCWTICVVASELMTNAFKHAFPESRPGTVDVVLRQDGEEAVLTVMDNGVGAWAGRGDPEAVWRAPGFGSDIVTRLAERLGGFVTRVSGPAGTTATLAVPVTLNAQ